MIALLQRVSHAEVTVEGKPVGAIGRGLLVLVGVRPADDEVSAKRLLARVLRYRVFPDGAGKMNLSLTQVGGQLLLVPQFTLAADTSKGLRPGFSTAAPPEQSRRLFDALVQAAAENGLSYKKMVSRAYHDSLFMARIAPVGMVFIPCRDGVSHRPDEYSAPQEIENGVKVLACALASLSLQTETSG